LRAIPFREVIRHGGPPLAGTAEDPVQDDQTSYVAEAVVRQEAWHPGQRAGLQPAADESVEPLEVLRSRVPRLVEGVVDNDPPRAGPCLEVGVAEPGGVTHVAEDEVDLALGPAPGKGVAVGAEEVGVAPGEPKCLTDQLAEQLASSAVVVLAACPLDD